MTASRPPAPHAVSGTMLYLGARRIETRHGGFTAHLCRNLATGAPALAVGRGPLTALSLSPAVAS